MYKVQLIRKKNRDLQFFVDYQRLNDVTKKDCFAISRSDNTLDMLAASNSYSALDLKSCSWQIALKHSKENNVL
jgi:hypothetical protein